MFCFYLLKGNDNNYYDIKHDLTDNSEFMEYFFDENDKIPAEKKTFLRRLRNNN